MKSLKPWRSFVGQLHQLQARGLQVDNHASALDYLERLGYYRLQIKTGAYTSAEASVVLLAMLGRPPALDNPKEALPVREYKRNIHAK